MNIGEYKRERTIECAHRIDCQNEGSPIAHLFEVALPFDIGRRRINQVIDVRGTLADSGQNEFRPDVDPSDVAALADDRARE